MDASTDNNLSPGEKILMGDIIPYINRVSKESKYNFDHPLWVMMTRRLAIKDHGLDKLHTDLDHHYKHQMQYNDSSKH